MAQFEVVKETMEDPTGVCYLPIKIKKKKERKKMTHIPKCLRFVMGKSKCTLLRVASCMTSEK